MMPPWRNGRTFLIAEAGVNHDGDIGRAIAMVELAAEVGADAVKFQTFRADAVVTRKAALANYQQRNSGTSGPQLNMLRTLELSDSDHWKLKRRADELGILFFSTAFDHGSIDFLTSMNQQLWKIPSGEITNFPYLVRIARKNQPTILSTGMASLAEVAAAVETLDAHGLDRRGLCILHCNTEYPTPPHDVNLRAMPVLGAAFGCTYGYSDHTEGTAVSVAAAALGASVIEKHFTDDRDRPGPDHAASLSPDQLQDWVASVRLTDEIMGSSEKRPTPSEIQNRAVARKTVVAGRRIEVGETLTEQNLAVKRAGGGISPMLWPQIVGRRAPREFAPDDPIEL